MLDIPAGKGISSGESARRLLGRTLFPHERPGWARAVVCAPALAVFQQPDELIGGEEKLAKVFVHHALAHVLPGMGSRKETTCGLRLGLQNDRAEPAFPFSGV